MKICSIFKIALKHCCVLIIVYNKISNNSMIY